MHILAAEDEPAMAGLLQSALSEEGYLVTLATDGGQAWQLGQTSRFDLILLDLMLPGLNGFEIVQRLRKARIQTPILVLTARDAPADIVKALDSGADDYLTKPGASPGSQQAGRDSAAVMPSGRHSHAQYCQPPGGAREQRNSSHAARIQHIGIADAS